MLKGYGKAYNYLTRMVVAVTPSSRGINTFGAIIYLLSRNLLLAPTRLQLTIVYMLSILNSLLFSPNVNSQHT